jgi:hypothetical protein
VAESVKEGEIMSRETDEEGKRAPSRAGEFVARGSAGAEGAVVRGEARTFRRNET